MPTTADARQRTTRFVDLLTANQRKLYAYISMLLMGDVAAADVLQDTNLDLWARLEEYDFERDFVPWAFAFARQRVLAYRKTQARSRLILGVDVEELFDAKCADFAHEADARLAALRQCLRKLEPGQAELIRSRYSSQTPLRQLAEQLRQSEHNISCRLHRIRKALARCVKLNLAWEERG